MGKSKYDPNARYRITYRGATDIPGEWDPMTGYASKTPGSRTVTECQVKVTGDQVEQTRRSLRGTGARIVSVRKCWF